MTSCPDDGWSFTVESDATVHPPDARRGTMGGLAAALANPDAPPPSTDLVPGFVVGEYKIEKKIGEGGMGAVYAATHPLIGKRAAIKVISAALGAEPSAVTRFVQEARSVNQIGHPNIVDVFAFGELPDGRNYFVMEYLQGESLADRLGRTAMPLGEAIEILDQVADALEAAHEKQIVHRDLKPDNVYLAAVRGGRTMVKLLDFGIAKLSVAEGSGTGGVAKTRTGMMMGTPGYLSPEQARGKNVDHRTDVYALGCMTFEIVCGRIPFIADNAMDIVLMHMTAAPPRASELWPEIPPPLDQLISRMLEKDANARPTLAEIRACFAELVTSGLVTLNGGRGVAFGSGIGRLATPGTGVPIRAVGTQPSTQTGTAPPMPALATAPPTAKSKMGLVAAVLGVVVVGGVAAVALTRGGSSEPPPAPPPPVAQAPAPAPAAAPAPPPPVAATAPVVQPQPPKPGTLEIRINVDKAQVVVDGSPVTVTGRVAKAPEPQGEHEIVVSAPGRADFTTKVTVASGETAKVEAKLEAAKVASKKPGKPDRIDKTAKPDKPAPDKPPVGSGSAAPVKTKQIEDKNYTVDPFAQ